MARVTISLPAVRYKATLAGAISILSGIVIAITLLANGSKEGTAVIALISGTLLPTLNALYQSQANGDKADTAAVKADTAASKAETAADVAGAAYDKLGAVHNLVNGGLESRILTLMEQNLPIILVKVLGGSEENPPLLRPEILNPTQTGNTNA